ncbi:3-keto-5-aminohexanoate cleavage protein [Sneathiella chinensis]|uniref:3-keto-5-aminohexanoate cleavage protein n=1 Tax=Sneathiella chinensis TaxID=349750 RepID=A0ABQ5U0R8_9PROT|nr:3-keto-5-aminohexanoate cleavage protein [Sneathiella chinensis]GLQ05792.1 3-keto-5-aminohexanoate cleavage protein [Sneathiella chinensis]
MSETEMTQTPLIITVAPNGARKTQADHPALPISPEELAREAKACAAAGAAMIHLHVRKEDKTHTLDPARYREAMSAIRDACGDDILIQVTTEAVGLYEAPEQMAVIRELAPQSASLAIREIVPEGGEEQARAFLHEIVDGGTLPHYILYSADDLKRYLLLRDQGVIPDRNEFLLFVLGRYTAGQVSHPGDLIPFLGELTQDIPWSVCAFGPLEHAAASAAVALGGHVRVGFENNMLLKSGETAGNNAELVQQIRDVAEAVGRPVASAAEARKILTV